MIRSTLGSRRSFRLTGIALILGALAGCEDGTAFLQPKDKPATEGTVSSTKTTKLVEQDVEAPDVFQVTEAALWDGRPSLGGVWVAHPDVTDPQRVIIRNTANNKSVVGALFRRERDIPGPRIQASSDAADALAMLAGAPVQLDVTALIREPVEEEEPQVQAEETVVALEDNPEITETPLDPIVGATAAIEASEPSPNEIEAVEAAADSPENIEAAEPAKKKGFQWPWSKPKPAEVASPAEVAAASAATVATVAAASDAAPAETPKPQPRTSKLDKPFIQIGIFNVEENANRTANQIRGAGIIPTVYEQSSNGKPFWRVVVGPSQTKSEQSALLKKVKDTGFSDAYTVTN